MGLMRLHVVLEVAEEGGFVAECVEIPGAITEGETREEALHKMQDAVRAVLGVRMKEAHESVVRAQSATRRLEEVYLED
jgi:predicted RNase H-like HicB family nuclease